MILAEPLENNPGLGDVAQMSLMLLQKEDLGSVPSTHVKQLITSWTSGSRELTRFSGLLEYCTHTDNLAPT